MIAIINETLVFIIRSMANEQGKHSLTEKLESIIDKLWIIQFLNSSMLVVLLSSNVTTLNSILPSWFPVLQGRYEDITEAWFKDVGVVVALSCFTNCVLSIKNVSNVLKSFIKQCLDRGCTRDPKKTKQVV